MKKSRIGNRALAELAMGNSPVSTLNTPVQFWCTLFIGG